MPSPKVLTSSRFSSHSKPYNLSLPWLLEESPAALQLYIKPPLRAKPSKESSLALNPWENKPIRQSANKKIFD